MKKTNVALFHSATRWVRYLPLLLCIIVFSSSDLAAQNYKTPGDAAEAVKGALEQVMGDLDATNARVDQVTTNSEKQDVFSFQYYSLFLDQLEDLNDTEEAMEAIDKMFHPVKMTARTALIETARDELTDLITD